MKDRTRLTAKFSLAFPSMDPNKQTVTTAKPSSVSTRTCSSPLLLLPLQEWEYPPHNNLNHPFWHDKDSKRTDRRSGNDSLGTKPRPLS